MARLNQLILLREARGVSSGGKANNLAKLIKWGLPVPSGYVVPPAENNEDQKTLKKIIREVFNALRSPLIARSSAGVEDAIATSFAGQFVSVYPIHTERELINAIVKVRAGARSATVAAYLRHYNISSNEARVAVIIQEYKKPRLSGVVFSSDTKNPDWAVIEAAGEAGGIVAGKTVSERVYIDKKSGKPIKKGLVKPVLPDRLITELFNYSVVIETKFKQPQDIEWVYDGHRIWIVQTRPISATALDVDKITKGELNRLRNQFGDRVPYLTPLPFADALEFITPSTVDLLRKIFSPDGAWGRLMRRYFVPFQTSFDPKLYILDVFGRPFVNKDREREILSRDMPYEVAVDENQVGLWQEKQWRYRGLSNLIYSLPRIALSVIGVIKFQIEMIWQYRRMNRAISRLSVEIEQLERLPKNIGNMRVVLNHFIHKTSCALLRNSMFQQFALQNLRKRLSHRIADEEWRKIIGMEVENIFLNAVGRDIKNALKDIGHRGFQELELSRPRWREEPEIFTKFIFESKSRRVSAARRQKPALQSVNIEREQVISRFLGVWDKQIIAAFFLLYDQFSRYRERLRDLWARELSVLRAILLELDRRARSLNSIWFLPLDKILSDFPDYNVKTLLRRRREHELIRRLPILQSARKIKRWRELLRRPAPTMAKGGVYRGRSLTFGYAEGIAGDLKTLQSGAKVEILVTPNLDPAIAMFFGVVKGVVAEAGGELSHAAIVAREYGVPIIVLADAVRLLRSGAKIIMDGKTGVINVIGN